MRTKRIRLKGKTKVTLPKPKQKSDGQFELKTINKADGRFHVVKRMRERIARMVEDCDADTLQKEWLVGHAVYLQSYLESQQSLALEGNKQNWRDYLAVLRQLADVLNKLGLDRAVKGAKSLEDYLESLPKKKSKKRKVQS